MSLGGEVQEGFLEEVVTGPRRKQHKEREKRDVPAKGVYRVRGRGRGMVFPRTASMVEGNPWPL